MSGLFIPDMNAPKTCCECPCFDGEYLTCNLTEKEVYQEIDCEYGVSPNCPLIEMDDRRVYILFDNVLYGSDQVLEDQKAYYLPPFEIQKE